MEQKKNLLTRIFLLWKLCIFLNLFCFVQLIISVIVPDILVPILKTWLIVIAGGSSLGLSISLFLARNDPTTTIYLCFLSIFIDGLISGISIVIIITKVKN